LNIVDKKDGNKENKKICLKGFM